MSKLRPHLRLLSWIALVAMLALAVVPGVSRALAAGGSPDGLTEVCTPQGMKMVAPDGSVVEDGRALPQHAAGHLDHCPLCSLGAQALGLPPATFEPLLAGFATEFPALFLQAAHTLFAWRSAQPRGPPSLT